MLLAFNVGLTATSQIVQLPILLRLSIIDQAALDRCIDVGTLLLDILPAVDRVWVHASACTPDRPGSKLDLSDR